MEALEIRAIAAVSVLPPREGFSPEAVGAVGMVVRRLATPDDLVIGAGGGPEPFDWPRLLPISPVLWPPFGRTNRYMAGVISRLRALRPPLVEVHNRANLAADVARALPGSRLALFVHNDPQGMHGARTAQERTDLLLRMRVICVSRYLRDRFMEQVPPGAPEAVLLSNAIDLAALPPPLPSNERERVFLFVGRAVSDKGADAFVRAYAAIRSRVPGWRAVLIGSDRFRARSPETPFLRRLRGAAYDAGVEMLGYRRHAEVMEAMSRAAIVVVPSRWAEPFGLTALEALANGAALICAPHGALPEVAGDTALYAPPEPPGALEDAMQALALDDHRRAGLAAAGIRRAALFDATAARARLQALRAG